MSNYLPTGGYQWLECDDVNSELFTNPSAILNLSDESADGYIFEVDLAYPQHLHDVHNDYPFCAEKRKLPAEAVEIVRNILLSDSETRGRTAASISKTEKLLLTLYDKKKYVLDYRMLKLALTHGLELKKVHRIVKFDQSPWLKPYIDLNIALRKEAKNEFQKEFFKLLINSIFGKTMENIRLRADIKLVSKWGGRCGARMLIARPNFKQCRIFDEELVAIEMNKTSILMNKPIAIGMCVLDLSKITMYKFLYDFLKPKYGKNCSVAYTDTDSFILCIKTPDFYEDIRNNIDMFDTSNYPRDNEYNIGLENKGIPGLFKDELKGRVMVEFVGLRAKCYAVRTLYKKSDEIMDKKLKKKPNNVIKRSKGVQKCVVKRKIKFDDFLECFREHCELDRTQKNIRSLKHNVYSITQTKIALNPCDDKRFIRKRKSDTLAWGHYKISNDYANYYESGVGDK